MYDPEQMLAVVDAHRWSLLALCGLALVGNYIWFIAAIRVSHRDKVYSIPLVLTFFWVAHDGSVVYRAGTWFGYHHWFPLLWWAALCGTTAIEMVFLAQAFRYGRAEIMPDATPRTWALLMAAALAVSFTVWEAFKSVMVDGLYLWAFGITICSYVVFGVPLLIRRRSTAGQVPAMWAGYTLTGICYFTAAAVWFGGHFRDWQWIGMGVISVVGGIGMTVAVARQRRSDAIEAPTVAAMPAIATLGG